MGGKAMKQLYKAAALTFICIAITGCGSQSDKGGQGKVGEIMTKSLNTKQKGTKTSERDSSINQELSKHYKMYKEMLKYRREQNEKIRQEQKKLLKKQMKSTGQNSQGKSETSGNKGKESKSGKD
jgi:hypothetical protein